jgi:hypothetical protein
MEKLIEKTGAKQDDVIKVIEDLSIHEHFSLKSVLPLDKGHLL